MIIIEVYVDKIIFGSDDDKMIHKFSKNMWSEFEMSFIETQDRREITINNKKYVNLKTHYKRYIDIMWFTQDGLHPQRNCQSFIIIPSNKMKG